MLQFKDWAKIDMTINSALKKRETEKNALYTQIPLINSPFFFFFEKTIFNTLIT